MKGLLVAAIITGLSVATVVLSAVVLVAVYNTLGWYW